MATIWLYIDLIFIFASRVHHELCLFLFWHRWCLIFLKTTGTLSVVSADARELITPRLKISWLSWNVAWEMMPEEVKATRIEVTGCEDWMRFYCNVLPESGWRIIDLLCESKLLCTEVAWYTFSDLSQLAALVMLGNPPSCLMHPNASAQLFFSNSRVLTCFALGEAFWTWLRRERDWQEIWPVSWSKAIDDTGKQCRQHPPTLVFPQCCVIYFKPFYSNHYEHVRESSMLHAVKTGPLSVPNRNHFDGLCAFRYLVAVLLFMIVTSSRQTILVHQTTS